MDKKLGFTVKLVQLLKVDKLVSSVKKLKLLEWSKDWSKITQESEVGTTKFIEETKIRSNEFVKKTEIESEKFVVEGDAVAERLVEQAQVGVEKFADDDEASTNKFAQDAEASANQFAEETVFESYDDDYYVSETTNVELESTIVEDDKHRSS